MEGSRRWPSGSLRVSAHAGIDPVSKKRNYLVETVPAGTTAARDAERVRTRLLNQLDERRNPRTKATVSQLLDRWLEVAEMETTSATAWSVGWTGTCGRCWANCRWASSTPRLSNRCTPNFDGVASDALAAAKRRGINAGRWRRRRSA